MLGDPSDTLKHDRGKEFINANFSGALEEKEVISLPSPAYYAPFNSITERTVRLLRRFTRPLEARYYTRFNEISDTFVRAQRIINHEFPRMIFKGETSDEVYAKARDYEDWERKKLIKEVFSKQRLTDGKYFLNGKELDKQRKEVVKYLCQMNLCYVHYRIKKVKLNLAG